MEAAAVDALIGRLYRSLADAEGQRNALIQLVAALKAGKITLDRITATPGGFAWEFPPAAAEAPAVAD